MAEGINNPSAVGSPSLSMRTMSKLNSLDGSYQPKSTMWSGVTKNIYPQGKRQVDNPSTSEVIAKSMYSLLGLQYNPSKNLIEPFRRGSVEIPLKNDTRLRASYNKPPRQSNYNWNVEISVPIGR